MTFGARLIAVIIAAAVLAAGCAQQPPGENGVVKPDGTPPAEPPKPLSNVTNETPGNATAPSNETLDSLFSDDLDEAMEDLEKLE